MYAVTQEIFTAALLRFT